MDLIAKAFENDPRLKEGKKLLLDAVRDHQKKLTHVVAPHPHLKVEYDVLLKKFAELRGAKLYFPYLGSGIGNGALVELLDGSVKYDLICGIGPLYWGHSHVDIVESGIDAALSDTVMQGNLQQNADALAYCELLTNAAGMEHCFLTTTGAMANENALKIAFQKKFPASRILAFDHCFAGRTLAVSQITDKANFRDGLPSTYHVDYIPFFDSEKPEESTEKALSALKTHLQRYPKQHAVMLLELIQGEGGFYTGSKEFFVSIMKVLKENNITVFADEVQTFGRTSKLFAFQHFGLEEYVDIVSIGKLSQVCATLFRKDYNPRPGLLSQTFIGSTSGLRAGKYIVKSLLSGDFFGDNGKIMKVREHFIGNLQAIAKKHPHLVKGPYGLGSMIAFTPFDGDQARVSQFIQDLFHAGVISFIAGANPARVRFLLPVGVITENDMDQATKIIEETLLKVKL